MIYLLVLLFGLALAEDPCSGFTGRKPWQQLDTSITTSCYSLNNGKDRKFIKASEKCQQQGGHLLEVHTESENIMIAGRIRNPVWLNMKVDYANNIQYWMSQPGVNASWTNWAPGEPNNHNSKEGCVILLPSGLWNDVPCRKSQARVCEGESEGGTVPLDCGDVTNTTSGVYDIQPIGAPIPVSVYCHMALDGRKWTCIQNRFDGSVDFFRGYTDYFNGFGDKAGEFWLGNYIINKLTSQGAYELRVDMSDFNNDERFAEYSSFAVGDEDSNFTLSVSGYTGDAGDSLSYHNGFPFSTFDQGNTGCAIYGHGAWWYKSCYYSNLNGNYSGPGGDGGTTMNWFDFSVYKALKTSRMCLRKL